CLTSGMKLGFLPIPLEEGQLVPRYIIERQYLVPIYEHLLVEAPSFEAACCEALDDHVQPWGDDAQIDFDNAHSTTIAQAVELPETLEPKLCAETADRYVLSDFLYPNFGSCLQARRQFACRFATIAGGVNLAGGVLAGLVAGRADIFAAPR